MSYKVSTSRKSVIDTLLLPHTRRLRRILKEVCSQYSNGYTLEVGAGTRPLREFVRGDYIAYDLTAYKGVDVQGDALNLPFRDGSFDLVLCNNMLEHVYDVKTAIAEMYRVLQDGGMFVLVTPFFFPLHDIPHDYYRFSRWALEGLLQDFSSIKIEEIGLFPRAWILDRLVLY